LRFIHTFRGRGRKKYVVRATQQYTDGGLVQTRYGLSAKFVRGTWDSLAAQKENGWSDQEREVVERHLMNHGDFGNGLYLDPEEARAASGEGHGAVIPTPPTMPGGLPQVCIATTTGPDGVTMCGKPIEAGSDYCPDHAKAFAA
jgi:hypothetical protein